MCILLNVKKHEKTFALNVDIFIIQLNIDLLWKNLTFCINIFIVCFHSHYDVLITRRDTFFVLS